MFNQTGFLILAAILLAAVVSIALIDFKGANAQGNAMGGAKNMTGGTANMTKNAKNANSSETGVRKHGRAIIVF